MSEVRELARQLGLMEECHHCGGLASVTYTPDHVRSGCPCCGGKGYVVPSLDQAVTKLSDHVDVNGLTLRCVSGSWACEQEERVGSGTGSTALEALLRWASLTR